MVLLIVKLIVLRLLPDLLVDVLLGLLHLLLTATVLHRSTDSDQEGWRNAVTERFRCAVKKEKWTGKEVDKLSCCGIKNAKYDDKFHFNRDAAT